MKIGIIYMIYGTYISIINNHCRQLNYSFDILPFLELYTIKLLMKNIYQKNSTLTRYNFF